MKTLLYLILLLSFSKPIDPTINYKCQTSKDECLDRNEFIAEHTGNNQEEWPTELIIFEDSSIGSYSYDYFQRPLTVPAINSKLGVKR